MNIDTASWVSFFAVVFIQLLVLLVARRCRISKAGEIIDSSIRPAPVLIALLLGLIFDIVIGQRNGVFSYRLNFTPLFAVANALLSYGIALATIGSLHFKNGGLMPFLGKTKTPYYIVLGVILAIALFPLVKGGPINIFYLGTIVIVIDELLLLIGNQSGPLLQLCFLEYRNFIYLWVYSVFIGLIYESANLIFPVWQWNFTFVSSDTATFAIIVGLGYFVLFHPCLVLAAIIKRASKR